MVNNEEELSKSREQRSRANAKRLGDLDQHINRGRFFAPLQFADVDALEKTGTVKLPG